MENFSYRDFDIKFTEIANCDFNYYEIWYNGQLYRGSNFYKERPIVEVVKNVKSGIDELYNLKTYNDVVKFLQNECDFEEGMIPVNIAEFVLFFYCEVVTKISKSKMKLQ